MATVTTVLSWLLGVVMLAAGGMKALLPEEKLLANPNMGWIERTGIGQARIAGASEVAAGLAFLGGALDVTPAGEPVVPNAVLGLLAVVLAVGAFTA